VISTESLVRIHLSESEKERVESYSGATGVKEAGKFDKANFTMFHNLLQNCL